ncbi:MAG: chitobiase/beta-hexosaminidase C-terminal domain-containing protein, partial [Planctomycetota bacterium]
SIDFDELPQTTDISYGRYPDGSGNWRYLATPTPGYENDGAYLGAVADTRFSHDRGFYDTAFELIISCETSGATIRYTIDGTKPTPSHGLIYSAPIGIGSTACVRAAAFKTGWLSSNVDTHTYVFGAHAARKALPTLSLAGIGGSDRGGTGKPVSLELLYPQEFLQSRGANWNGFQTDCEVADHSVNSYRLRWKSELGDAHLDYPFFEAAFDRLVLRVGKNSSTTYLGDAWTQVSEKVMTGFGCNSMFMHLYKNGSYAGIVNPKERPDAWSWSAYYGGEFDDYFVLNQNFEPHRGDKTLSGDRTRFDEMMSITGLGDLGTYEYVKALCDVTHFADYTILFWYSGFGDGCDNNYYGGMRNNPLLGQVPPEGFKMLMWDGEFCFTNSGGPSGHVEPWVPSYYWTTGAVIPHIWTKLLQSGEFQILFADRLYRHLYNDGPLTDENSWARWSALAADVIAAGASPGAVKNNMVGFAETLTTAVRAAGLYAEFDPPQFQHGGIVDPGYNLTMTGSGTIYYTLDGDDPRAPGGAVSAHALNYATVPPVLNESAVVKARLNNAGQWSALHEATFGVGAVRENLRISEIMYHPADPLQGSPYEDDDFEYIEFKNISGTATINLSLVRLTRGLDFTFPSLSLAPGQFVIVVKNQPAFESRYGTGIQTAGQYTGSLENAGETIELRDAVGQVILCFRYKDGWYDITDGLGFSLTVKDAASTDPNDWGEKSTWRP